MYMLYWMQKLAILKINSKKDHITILLYCYSVLYTKLPSRKLDLLNVILFCILYQAIKHLILVTSQLLKWTLNEFFDLKAQKMH